MNQLPDWAIVIAWFTGVISPVITLSIFITEYKRNKRVLRSIQALGAYEKVMQVINKIQFVIEKDKQFVENMNSMNLSNEILKDSMLNLLGDFDYKKSNMYISREASLVLNLVAKLETHKELTELLKCYYKDYNMSQHFIQKLNNELLQVNLMELQNIMKENHKKSEKNLSKIIKYCSDKL